MGRYQETPVKLLAELTPGGYTALGDPDDVQVRAATKQADWKDLLWGEILIGGSTWKTADELQERLDAHQTGYRRQDFLATIKLWSDTGEVERSGKGVKGSPFMYRAAQRGSDLDGSAPSE